MPTTARTNINPYNTQFDSSKKSLGNSFKGYGKLMQEPEIRQRHSLASITTSNSNNSLWGSGNQSNNKRKLELLQLQEDTWKLKDLTDEDQLDDAFRINDELQRILWDLNQEKRIIPIVTKL